MESIKSHLTCLLLHKKQYRPQGGRGNEDHLILSSR